MAGPAHHGVCPPPGESRRKGKGAEGCVGQGAGQAVQRVRAVVDHPARHLCCYEVLNRQKLDHLLCWPVQPTTNALWPGWYGIDKI
jgi:hypothetical protein